jgi:hypothetical protein
MVVSFLPLLPYSWGTIPQYPVWIRNISPAHQKLYHNSSDIQTVA